MRNILGRLIEPQLYKTMAHSLLDEEQAKALRRRISKKILENLDYM